jgi:hypothetical protein
VPPLTQTALAAFRRDLPDLLKKKYGQFVAYHGEVRLAFARDSFDLYHECYRRGLKDGEFIVEQIMPDFADDEVSEPSPEVW